jgi:hypothetical protein
VINHSLVTLGRVIAALVEGLSHVPYLDCKLTTLLKSAFAKGDSADGNNCKTTVIVNCRPEDTFGDETLHSLRFGERCRMISTAIKSIASTSFPEALQMLDSSLESMRTRIGIMDRKRQKSLNQQKQYSLPHDDTGAYKTLLNSYEALCVQRSILLGKDAQRDVNKFG